MHATNKSESRPCHGKPPVTIRSPVRQFSEPDRRCRLPPLYQMNLQRTECVHSPISKCVQLAVMLCDLFYLTFFLIFLV